VRQLVMHVIGVEERDEQVDVEKRRATHASSRRSFTCFMVGRAAPGGRRGSSGTPFRTRPALDGVRARRASSDTTLPAVVPRAAWPDHRASRIRRQTAPREMCRLRLETSRESPSPRG
jgi:hypothetical protein